MLRLWYKRTQNKKIVKVNSIVSLLNKERDGYKEIHWKKENRQASELQQEEQQKKGKKREIRRSRKIENTLKIFKVF